MPGLQVPAREWGWGPCLWRPDSTGTPAAHPEHLPRHHGGSHSHRSTVTPQGQWAQGPGKSGVTRGLLPRCSHRWNTNKKNNSWYLPRSTLCAGKRAECFQRNTPFCPPSTWGVGTLIIPILKIKKLRPEVTGAGHEVRQVALTEDALLPPLGALRGCGGAGGRGGHFSFNMADEAQGTLGGPGRPRGHPTLPPDIPLPPERGPE